VMNWLITDKGDQDVRLLADEHYTRQTPGALSFTRNGQNLVFVTPDLLAGWSPSDQPPARRSDRMASMPGSVRFSGTLGQ
jgi:molecular chaperone DnaK (HSP70)